MPAGGVILKTRITYEQNEMKRKLFFWLENLKITKAERVAVTLLVTLLLAVTLIRSLIPVSLPYDDPYYAALEEEFKMRTEVLREKENAILARYRPEMEKVSISAPDTLPPDSMETVKDEPDLYVGEAPSARININTADAKMLETLPGIGPAYASRIIEYRSKNGVFTSYDELLKIKGIGKKRLEKLLPFIQLKDPIENK